jgi:hypothetical protein
VREQAANVRAALGTAPMQQARPQRTKTPMPSKYGSKKGDLASTFIATCDNYCIMEPNAFTLDNTCIRWALQQLEDKAGLWAVRQMQRMTLKADSQGRPPKELRHWRTFKESFMAQFRDLGLINKAKQEWNSGITQTRKAVDCDILSLFGSCLAVSVRIGAFSQYDFLYSLIYRIFLVFLGLFPVGFGLFGWDRGYP